MTVHLPFVVIISTAMLVAVATGSFSRTFAALNKAGLPSSLLVETTDLSDSRQVEKLLAHLQDAEFQDAVKHAVLQQSVETSRALNEDWEDPVLCQHDWLSWLPWLDCIQDTPQRASPPIFFREEGECYREL